MSKKNLSPSEIGAELATFLRAEDLSDFFVASPAGPDTGVELAEAASDELAAYEHDLGELATVIRMWREEGLSADAALQRLEANIIEGEKDRA